MTDSNQQRHAGSAVHAGSAGYEAAYLAGLSSKVARKLARVNAAGLAALRPYLDTSEGVGFLGVGASAPLYPLWTAAIAELVDAAVTRGLDVDKATTCRELASEQPDAVVEVLRRHLGPAQYQQALREAFRVRRDPVSGRTWTPTQELVCRCAFKAVVTTNYDPGIVDARMRVRPHALGTGFASWTDELALDRWRTGEVFGDDELPVLFAHGHHNQPDAMVLATTDYRRAYAGKLARVLAGMMDSWHLVWLGFSFSDQRVTAVLREVAEQAGTTSNPGLAPRHVAVMSWDPDSRRDPEALRGFAEIQYGADLILYPAPDGDHSALQTLLAALIADTYPPAPATPAPPSATTRRVSGIALATPASMPPGVPVEWVPPPELVAQFTGRVEELARLSRWAADSTVRLVGVTAWGGAGKTALVAQWIHQAGGLAARPGLRGVFAWSFYADPSAERWGQALVAWAAQELGVRLVRHGRLATTVLALLEAAPLVVVLDGLEVLQEGPEGAQFGRLLDGTLREVLTGACRAEHTTLVVLTSRFAFADLEGFEGSAARMLDVSPFTPAEGAALLAASGGGWLPEATRSDLVQSVDGHALAVAVLGSALADRPPTAALDGLRAQLAQEAATNTRVAKVLGFYAARLAEADRYLVAAVALFGHPITPQAVLAVAGHASFDGRLEDWTEQQVETAARGRLAGLLSWHPDGTLSAHPLVRDSFRPLALGAAEVAADATLANVPAGRIGSREDGLRVVEAIELLVEADQWKAAESLWSSRTASGKMWMTLPAARLGQRAASAFVATPDRRQACSDRLHPSRVGYYLNSVGLHAMNGGDVVMAREYLDAAVHHHRDADGALGLAIRLQNLATCLGHLGEVELAGQAAAAATTHAAADDSLENITEYISDSEAYQGWTSMLAGETRAAEMHFIAAARIQYAESARKHHLYSLPGVWWGEFLAKTGRPGPARTLTELNRAISAQYGWNATAARCDRLLGRLDLADGNTTTARQRLTAAAATFRDGDYLIELAATLPILANCARISGDTATAERHAEEALTIGAPRGLHPSRAAALTVRAHTLADRAAAGSPDDLNPGRDAAEAARRIAARRRLAWQELDAADAHARLDQVEGADHGWAGQAATLRARLMPAGMDPDPLATIERLAAEKQTPLP